jgi:hypothetical protein
MSVEIRKRVSDLSDEEILKLLTSHFPDYRKQWINFSEEELRKRGFELEPTDTELRVITPGGEKLTYPKVQSDVGPKPQQKTDTLETDRAVWTPVSILLAVLSALASLVLVGLVSFVLLQILAGMESPGNRLPDWVAKIVVILIIGMFIGIWKVIFALLLQRFDAD